MLKMFLRGLPGKVPEAVLCFFLFALLVYLVKWMSLTFILASIAISLVAVLLKIVAKQNQRIRELSAKLWQSTPPPAMPGSFSFAKKNPEKSPEKTP